MSRALTSHIVTSAGHVFEDIYTNVIKTTMHYTELVFKTQNTLWQFLIIPRP